MWNGLADRETRGRVARECRGGEIGSAAVCAFVAASVAAAFYAVKRFVAEVVPERRARASPASSRSPRPRPPRAPPRPPRPARPARPARPLPPNSREDDEESGKSLGKRNRDRGGAITSRPPRDRPLGRKSYASVASRRTRGGRARDRVLALASLARAVPERPFVPGRPLVIPPEPPPPLPRLSEMRHPPAAWRHRPRPRVRRGWRPGGAARACLDVRHATRPYPCARSSRRASIVRDARE